MSARCRGSINESGRCSRFKSSKILPAAPGVKMDSARPESGPEFFGVGQSTRHKSISPWSPDRYVVADLECHLTAQDVDYFVAVVVGGGGGAGRGGEGGRGGCVVF